jgi:hypothetical protein
MLPGYVPLMSVEPPSERGHWGHVHGDPLLRVNLTFPIRWYRRSHAQPCIMGSERVEGAERDGFFPDKMACGRQNRVATKPCATITGASKNSSAILSYASSECIVVGNALEFTVCFTFGRKVKIGRS